MSVKEKLLRLSNNALFAGVLAGLLVIAITALITKYAVDQTTEVEHHRIVETVTIGDVQQALGEAKENVEATGYVISKLTPDDVNDKMRDFPKFTTSIVMVNPFSPVICQRQHDEDNQPRNYQQILSKLREFRQKSPRLIGERLRVGVSDVYPTMTVIIIDDDLMRTFTHTKD